ncbi:adenylate/guanylate cyclase domain-containing protein [Antrihabitans sp. YC2-6]|uniref:adenylate/guanylate cyclase domain-containing protein n=1 Tax=Antrihabitans sp. YC2-6 TaxID=2799498 RepID=UPI0018F4713E|nr:adenylate/guanylate cyclase domain-containing protein [Antrihabitans sp. YC2-6]MBJ8348935.1 adenylate/guanylate cyclase domain-containing protein [Antrihabitans sp. YC2-6]
MLETVLVLVVLVESIVLFVVGGLLIRSRYRVRQLERQLASGRERSWLASGRGAVKAVWETANLVREQGITKALRSSVEDLAGWAQVEQPDLARLAARDGTVTIFFSDIEGSTALNDQLGDKAWVGILSRHDKILRSRIAKHSGHVVKTQGDGFMVAFARPDEAVRCGIDVQRKLSDPLQWTRGTDVRVRIGIHTGDAVRRGDDLFGRNVALAARVAAQADGGEVLVSDVVRAAVAEESDLTFGTPRAVELKGLRGIHQVHPVEWVGPTT